MSGAQGSRVGDFIVLELLGRGGMGAVYRARHEPTGTLVALKVIEGDQGDDVLVARLRREARTAMSIDHPNVTRVQDAGIADGTPFIAYELVTGGSLRSELKRRGPFTWPEVVVAAREIASALEAIHAAGLVHRDLKPDNVLLDASGRCKVSDLGLVRKTAAAGGASVALTQPGDVVGTFAYMPPEQSDGGDVDFRADLYSFGILLYELLTGAVPFSGVGLSVLKKHHLDRPRPPREVVAGIPPVLEAIVLALLAKDPAARPASAAAVVASLARVDAPAPRRARFLAAGLALAVLAALGSDLARRSAREGLAGAPGEDTAAVASAFEADARRAFERADPIEAIELATSALERAPGSVPTRVLRARALMRRVRLAEARADLDLALRIDPGSLEAVVARAEVADRQGDRARAHGDRARANQLLWPRFDASMIAKDYAAGLRVADEMVALDGTNAGVLSLRGNALWLLGKHDEALAVYGRVLELDPRPGYYGQRCAFLREIRQYEASLADAAEWLKGEPASAPAHLMRGANLFDLHRYVDALPDLDEAVRLDPKNPVAYVYRAETRGNLQDARGAAADARRYLELDPRGFAARNMTSLIARVERGDPLKPAPPPSR